MIRRITTSCGVLYIDPAHIVGVSVKEDTLPSYERKTIWGRITYKRQYTVQVIMDKGSVIALPPTDNAELANLAVKAIFRNCGTANPQKELDATKKEAK